MSDFQYCSACLATCVKFHNFISRTSPLKDVERISKIIEIPLEIYNCSFCFECARFLAKCEEFKSKCRRTQNILSALGTQDKKEIYKYIKTLNRMQNGLTSCLAPSQTIHHDNQTPITANESEKDTYFGIETIKNEINYELSEFEDVDCNLGSLIDIKKRKRNKEVLNKSQKKIKVQESVSDDEPLASIVRKNTDNKHDTDKIEEIGNIKLEEFGTKNEPEEINTNSYVKKVKKINSDFEDYATVVFLTPEDARNEVLLRKESSNYMHSPFKCDLCYRGYEAKPAFENHMKKHNIEYGEYQCEICQLRFPQQRYLCKHRLASHKRKFCCKLCPYICFCMHQAKTHVSLHKGKKYPCKECGEVFSMPNSLLMHKRLKHSTECVCELCGHTFATPRGLHSHNMKLHRQHINEKLGPKCEDCNKHFATNAAWKLHLVLSSKHSVSNGCKFCGDIFNTSQDLKCHLRVHSRKHSRDSIKLPARCSLCEKWLHDRAEYRLHISTMHPDSAAAKKEALTPFVCEVCGKMFKKQCFLTYHQRKHTGERPYQCAQCNKTFQLAGALSTHRAVHSKKGAHKCGICARVFTFKSVLNKHMKVHLGIRPHRCDICDKSFISPCDVKVHIKYVHNKVPWPKRDRTKLTEALHSIK